MDCDWSKDQLVTKISEFGCLSKRSHSVCMCEREGGKERERDSMNRKEGQKVKYKHPQPLYLPLSETSGERLVMSLKPQPSVSAPALGAITLVLRCRAVTVADAGCSALS